MMHKSMHLVIIILMCLGSGEALSAQAFLFESPQFPSARMNALGGLHAALADDITTLVSNPAGFRVAGPQFSFAEVTMNLAGPVFSIADLVIKISGGANPLTLLADPAVKSLLTSLYASGTVNGPLAFGYVGDGLGFGFFNTTGLSFTTQGTVPTMTASIREDMLFIGGYTFSISLPPTTKSALDLGVSLKAFARSSVGLNQSILGIFSLLASPSFAIIMAQPFDLDVGFGIDAGVLYSWNGMFSAGIVGRDAYAPVMRNSYTSVTAFTTGGTPTISYGVAPFNLAAGILFSPPLGPLEGYLSDLKIMLDYNDLLDFVTHPATATNPVLHVGVGVEMVMLQILSLRAGFDQGYFSAGLGMNLTVFRMNLTMYGSELSTEPGLRPAYNLLASFEFRY